MKVAIFSETRYWGGLEAHAIALAKTLVETGHSASIVCIGAKTRRVYQPRLPQGIDLIELPEPVSRSPWAWWRALRHVEADAVALEKGTLWTGGLALDVVLRLKYGRFIAIQQLEPPDLPPRPLRVHFGRGAPAVGLWWLKWKWRGYARSLAPAMTVCVSEAVRERLTGQYAFDPDRAVTIRNGVDGSIFRPDSDVRGQVRQEWGLPADSFVFGYVGRLVHHKGVDVLIDAFQRVLADHPDRRLYLVIVGAGAERSALQAKVSELGLQQRILMLGPSDAPSRCHQGLDVFVMPSRSEALGIALLEAMSSGCAVIGSAVGGILEIITDNSLGLLVRPGDAHSLADAMKKTLLRAEPARSITRDAARAHVATHFDVRAQCSRIISLLGGASGRGAEMALRRARATR
jgi:glycosyltransferase involved in cell wall biosynthesis